jgi:glycosyltransferase involved in cell wall biosynthesis
MGERARRGPAGNQGSYFQPRVSIVIPVYNGSDFLGQAIDSALAQTYSNLEVIVVNDGSSDGGETERVARSYRDRIRYFSKPNGGVATALNFGIQQMTGDYFSWLSHDDLYRPHKIEDQVECLAQCHNPAKSVIYGNYAIFSHDRRKATPVALPDLIPDDFRYFITVQNTLHGCTLLVPMAAFAEHGLFDPKLRTTQDYDLWFRMAKTLQFVHHAAVLVEARSHENQGSRRMSETALQECDELLGNFVEKLSEIEVCRGGACSLPIGYLALSNNLTTRGFIHAGERAARLAYNSLADMFATIERSSEVSALVEELIRRMGKASLANFSPLEELALVRTEPRQVTPDQRLKDALKKHFPVIIPIVRTLRFWCQSGT